MSQAVTPQNLANSASEFAPLFVRESMSSWNVLCKLIANEVATTYGQEEDAIRIFVLDSNTGNNDEDVAIFFPVVAKNTEEGIKDREASTSRPELAMAQLQDKEDVENKEARGSGTYRISTSTGKTTVYGTAGVNTDVFGTTQYILKIAVVVN